jgi:acyl-CoA thioester hydrolase
MSEINRKDYAHWTEVPVRWGDVDRLGHVNNVQYFRYSEEARTAWVNALSKGMNDVWGGGQGPILAEIQCQFIQQVHHPATLQIGTRAVCLGNSSMQVNQGFFITGTDKPVASSHSRIVWFDYQNQCSIPLPDLIRQRLREIEHIAPIEA